MHCTLGRCLIMKCMVYTPVQYVLALSAFKSFCVANVCMSHVASRVATIHATEPRCRLRVGGGARRWRFDGGSLPEMLPLYYFS